MTHLAPTAIALAMYFCVADALLISQCYYYNSVNARRAAEIAQSGATETSETAPLLARRRSSTHSTHQHATTEAGSSAAPVGKVVGQEDETSDANSWTFNILSVLAVYAAGFAGWFLSYKAGAWDVSEPTPDAVAPIDPQQGQDDTWESIGLALGYASALCYIWYVLGEPLAKSLDLYRMRLTFGVQRPRSPNLQELQGEVLRG